ncbi:hypothetical protein DH2020_046361 [Rehmannia glutinosa]|uniref:OTU domain-containing protein n=1 Tax=Rehmannia glutinosa TaxID=99300 RepID=A0ABR0UBG7_REHGL
MTRILVQRGSAGSSSSSNQNRSSTSVSVPNPSSSSSSASPQQQVTDIAQVVQAVKDENLVEEVQEQIVVDELVEKCGVSDNKSEDISSGNLNCDHHEGEKSEGEKARNDDVVGSGNLVKSFGGLPTVKEEDDARYISTTAPVPPPKPSSVSSNSRRFTSADSNTVRTGTSRRTAGWPGVSSRSSPTGSRPSSPRSHCEGEGYNSADEQNPCFSSSYDDSERERQFEIDLRRVKGLEVRKMLEDGNCLFRAVADQVYGDSELYDLVRQMCIDYMERERDHFSQFITEGFTSYCKRKRRDKALLAEGRFYSDLELTEKEIERMVMEASRAEYLADDKFKQQLGHRESSTSKAEPSSSAARSDARQEGGREIGSPGSVLSGSMQIMLSMGFSYLQVIEAYSIFGDDVDSMVCYLLETSSTGRRKGKATE